MYVPKWSLYSSYIEYMKETELTDTYFVLEMISHDGFMEYHQEIEEMKFRVTDSKKKTDEDILMYLKKKYKIDNPKSISKLSKNERDEILVVLKKEFPIRQLQRVTGISRGVITKA